MYLSKGCREAPQVDHQRGNKCAEVTEKMAQARGFKWHSRDERGRRMARWIVKTNHGSVRGGEGGVPPKGG